MNGPNVGAVGKEDRTEPVAPPILRGKMGPPMMDVSALVTQMQKTLTAIDAALASLDSAVHGAKFDELERKRADAIGALSAAFAAESEALGQRRRAERDEIAERRRKEDEDRERRRQEEDAELAARDRRQDEERDERLKAETEEIERRTDGLMVRAEDEARMAVAEGREKIKALQKRQKVIKRWHFSRP